MAGWEQLVRSRRARLGAAGALAAVGLWAFLPYLTNEVGSEAWVNAPLLRLSSPIAGTVSPELPAPGAYLDTASSMVLVRARALDTDALGALHDEQAALQAGLALAERQLADIEAADRRLSGRAGRFGRAAVARLQATGIAADAEAQGCAAEALEADQQQARMEALAERGFATHVMRDRARAAAAATHARCTALAARAAATRGETDAARAGLYLAASAQDTPYAEQQRDRLMLRRQEVETVATAARAHLAELARRIRAEEARLAAARAYQALLPGEAVVWRALVSPGESVGAGAALVELADCAHRFVEVTLPERRMETVQPGSTARVRLIGSSTWLEGRVMGAVGAAGRRDAALVAALDERRDARALTVMVALPPSGKEAAARRCDIGRLAEVRFSRWRS